jgi:hypothetical protein
VGSGGFEGSEEGSEFESALADLSDLTPAKAFPKSASLGFTFGLVAGAMGVVDEDG